MPWVAGVDGCRGGWYVLLAQFKGNRAQRLRGILCSTFQEVIRISPVPAVIAIDIPVGLMNDPVPGGRACDRSARRFLGRPRSTSIFSPPHRKIISAKKYSDVRRHGLSIQAFHILPKIREVDAVVTPALQKRIFEAHPEAALKGLSGEPMKYSKKTSEGRTERLRALSPFFRGLTVRLRRATPPGCFWDDIVDAHALAVTAHRISEGRGRRFPEDPPTDCRGLRMEINC